MVFNNGSASYANSCAIQAVPVGSYPVVSLYDDSGTTLSAGISSKGHGTLFNTQCLVDVYYTSWSTSGTDATVSFNVTFKSGIIAQSPIVATVKVFHTESGTAQQTFGSGTTVTLSSGPEFVNATAIGSSVPPSTWMDYSFTLRDPQGYADIIQINVNYSGTGSPGCSVGVYPRSARQSSQIGSCMACRRKHRREAVQCIAFDIIGRRLSVPVARCHRPRSSTKTHMPSLQLRTPAQRPVPVHGSLHPGYANCHRCSEFLGNLSGTTGGGRRIVQLGFC
jgi:hypothetical protein